MSETFSQRPGSLNEETVRLPDLGFIVAVCLARGWVSRVLESFFSDRPTVKSGFPLACKPKGKIAPLALAHLFSASNPPEFAPRQAATDPPAGKSLGYELHAGVGDERIGRVVTTDSRGNTSVFWAVTFRVKFSPGEGGASIPALPHVLTVPVGRAAMTAQKGKWRDHPGKNQGELKALPDHRKDVISNPRIEQHLFTNRPKH
jgi:hypothetical protein